VVVGPLKKKKKKTPQQKKTLLPEDVKFKVGRSRRLHLFAFVAFVVVVVAVLVAVCPVVTLAGLPHLTRARGALDRFGRRRREPLELLEGVHLARAAAELAARLLGGGGGGGQVARAAVDGGLVQDAVGPEEHHLARKGVGRDTRPTHTRAQKNSNQKKERVKEQEEEDKSKQKKVSIFHCELKPVYNLRFLPRG